MKTSKIIDQFIINKRNKQIELTRVPQNYVKITGGVIKDPKVHEQVMNDFISWCESESFDLIGTCESPILGRNGNKEFFGLLAN